MYELQTRISIADSHIFLKAMKECVHENQSLNCLHHVSFSQQVVGTCKIKVLKIVYSFLLYFQNVFLYKSTTRTAFNLIKKEEKGCENNILTQQNIEISYIHETV